MMASALRGAVSFLTRLPAGGDAADWEAFRRVPATFPAVGYLVGALAGLAVVLPIPAATAVATYLVALYLLTGLTHADGLADLGDAAAVHGDAERRRAVLKDSATGVGGALALGVTLLVLAFGALGAAGIGSGLAAFRIVVAAEVGAKVGMALLVCLGDPGHEGLGSRLVGESAPADLVLVAALALPAIVAVGGTLPALAAALLAGPLVALLVKRWADRRLGGITGDVLGAANELGRATALHAGVVVWTLF
ncbi:adenosylcobinamide-GDP ribazoletransferase [Halorarum halophilum]|uniref:Adenosylcobinamide-GDP ribazoletransferase n=1 Tax=Halorarum halophilum TaxID=2743090 RepID=A0A7D5KA29_9EURY|nr:adenosylcobinamide-GDP ribazoletransferase [Halobaculum halophilum]QLG29554.1 adenosylcobinamide-GDP ribazoletransferase [Halobaculum halophilum]